MVQIDVLNITMGLLEYFTFKFLVELVNSNRNYEGIKAMLSLTDNVSKERKKYLFIESNQLNCFISYLTYNHLKCRQYKNFIIHK